MTGKRNLYRSRSRNLELAREQKKQDSINRQIDSLSDEDSGSSPPPPIIEVNISSKDKVKHFEALVSQSRDPSHVAFDLNSMRGSKRSHEESKLSREILASIRRLSK